MFDAFHIRQLHLAAVDFIHFTFGLNKKVFGFLEIFVLFNPFLENCVPTAK